MRNQLDVSESQQSIYYSTDNCKEYDEEESAQIVAVSGAG